MVVVGCVCGFVGSFVEVCGVLGGYDFIGGCVVFGLYGDVVGLVVYV